MGPAKAESRQRAPAKAIGVRLPGVAAYSTAASTTRPSGSPGGAATDSPGQRPGWVAARSWEAISKFADLGEVVHLLPPDRVIQLLGVPKAIETIGLQQVIDELLAHYTPEQILEMLRQRQQE